jgi:hypothetical protein
MRKDDRRSGRAAAHPTHRRMVRRMSEPAPGRDDQLAALEPAHLAAFRAFSRAPGESDQLAVREPGAMALLARRWPIPAARLKHKLNPTLARCVYEGEHGRIYIVPGPGSVCLVSIAEFGKTVIGPTRVATHSGLGHAISGWRRDRRTGERRDLPTTFIGVLPTGGHNLRIIDRAEREFRVPLTPDDAYWITVADPVDMAWATPDGDHRHPCTHN